MAVFDHYFPVLGSKFGLGALGIFQFMSAPSSFQTIQRLIISSLFRISIQILSHYAEHFTLVSTSFFFALGCVNMLLGLIFGESIKAKRSISAWRALGVKSISKDNLSALSVSSNDKNRRTVIDM
jgi:hypothetical protein